MPTLPYPLQVTWNLHSFFLKSLTFLLLNNQHFLPSISILFLFLSVNFITISDWMLRSKAAQRKMRAQLQLFPLHLKNIIYKIEQIFLLHLNIGGSCSLVWSLPCFIDCPNGLIMGHSVTLKQCTTSRVNVFGEGMTLPGRSDVSQEMAEPCRLQLCAVLESCEVTRKF